MLVRIWPQASSKQVEVLKKEGKGKGNLATRGSNVAAASTLALRFSLIWAQGIQQ